MMQPGSPKVQSQAQMATEPAEDDDHQQHGRFDDETMRMLSANLPDRIFRVPDPRIQMAAIEAERTNQMTPVLKEELRLKILTKRMERGEPDIETTHTPQTYELTEEEKEKRERRKEQNRRAAKKCREKRKLRNLDVAEKFDILREENEKLNSEIKFRMKQREQLLAFIKDHVLSGNCKRQAPQMNSLSKPDSSSTSCHNSSGRLRQLTQSSSSKTNSTRVSANISHPPSSTSKQPKLSLTIPGNYHQSLINIGGSSSSSSSSKIYQILLSPSQTSPMNQPSPTLVQNVQRSHPPPHLFPFQPSATTSTTTTTVAVSPTTNQPIISSTQHSYLNQQQQQQQSLYNPSYGITAAASINLPATASPKPGQPPRPAMSRTPSTSTPFAPPQSPCTGNQSSSLTLTPPPSVSSEQYFVPESPSILNTLTTTTTTTSGVSNDLMIQCSTQPVDQNILTPPIIYPQFSTGNGLNYQLSPADSLSGKSPPAFDILTDKMFDDEDDDDDDGRNDFSHIWKTLQ